MTKFWSEEWNPDEVQDSIRNPLPAGKYTVVITDSAMKDNKSGTGEHLALTMQVIEGEHQGRMLWSVLNIRNNSAEAERIGRSELKALCQAVGVMKPDDNTDLHDKPFKVTVKIDPKDADRNLVRGYAPAGGEAKAKPKAAAPAPSPAPVTEEAEKKAPPPWKRK